MLLTFIYTVFFFFFSSSDEFDGSKQRKKDFGRIPDLSIDVKHLKHTQTIFLCEVKSAMYMAKHPQSHPDKVKLVNMMKDELDRAQNKYAINGNIKVFGVLIEGIYQAIIDNYLSSTNYC